MKEIASGWFKNLQTEICAMLEKLEQETILTHDLPCGTFVSTPWERTGGGGGIMSVMRGGRVFEKAGVNISTVFGEFSPEFRGKIPGTEDNPEFWASGISLVIHPRSPHVPIVHMNTRMIVTSKSWFGGGADLTPIFPIQEDTDLFHKAMKEACDPFDENYYEQFQKWCDEYFYIKHRKEIRGVGGIFYDDLNSGDFDHDFSFTKAVGLAFKDVYSKIVRRHYNKLWNQEETKAQLLKRTKYAEFNLIYDRGTDFGLKTGGNYEAIFVSLPPSASWA